MNLDFLDIQVFRLSRSRAGQILALIIQQKEMALARLYQTLAFYYDPADYVFEVEAFFYHFRFFITVLVPFDDYWFNRNIEFWKRKCC